MENNFFKGFISKFEDLNIYLKCLQIIKLTYNKNSKNFEEVTRRINQTLGLCLPAHEISSLIDHMQIFGNLHGFDFVDSYEINENKFQHESNENNMTSLILTPKVEMCYFCKSDKNTKLEFAGLPFAKEPIVFRKNGLG